MFLEIPPHSHEKHKNLLSPIIEWFKDKPLLQSVFDNLAKGSPLNLSKESHLTRAPLRGAHVRETRFTGTFLVFSDENKELLGGAYLLNQEASSLYPRIDPSIRKLLSPHSHLWVGTLFLCTEEHGFSKEYEFLCKTFYKTLHQKLVEFGQRENINYLYMILEPGESLCTEVLGDWPYVHQVALGDSSKGLSHHILSLAKTTPRVPMFQNSTQSFDWLKLAANVSAVSPRQAGEGSYCFY